MSGSGENIVDFRRRQQGLGSRNGNGGNGDLIGYRLDELERRMGLVESKVDSLVVTCTQIDERLKALVEKQDGLASKSYVLWIFGVSAAVLAVTLVGHMFIRSMSGT